jgi:hypothetical protein
LLVLPIVKHVVKGSDSGYKSCGASECFQNEGKYLQKMLPVLLTFPMSPTDDENDQLKSERDSLVNLVDNQNIY